MAWCAWGVPCRLVGVSGSPFVYLVTIKELFQAVEQSEALAGFVLLSAAGRLPWSGSVALGPVCLVLFFSCVPLPPVSVACFLAFGVRFPCAVFVLVNAIVNPTLYKVKPKLARFLILCNLSSRLNKNGGFYGVNCTLYTRTQNPRRA